MDAEGRQQSQIELQKQCKRNEELMCNHEVATKDMVPTPATQGGHVPDIPLPDGALISDDDDCFFSYTESEGGFGGANTDDNDSDDAIPSEGAQGRNFAVGGEGHRRSMQRRDPIQRLVPGANNIRGYPETVWKSDADGRLERFNLWTIKQGLTKLAKLNQDVFTLTLGSWQIPPRALILLKKKKQLKFKQYHRRLKENGDLLLSMLSMTDGIPTVAELMDSPLAKYITLAANDCGYSGMAEELIVTYVVPCF